MDKIYVVLIKNGLVMDVSDFAIEERDAAISTFKYHYRTEIGTEPDDDNRIDEILATGYIGFGQMGENTIQMTTVIS